MERISNDLFRGLKPVKFCRVLPGFGWIPFFWCVILGDILQLQEGVSCENDGIESSYRSQTLKIQ